MIAVFIFVRKKFHVMNKSLPIFSVDKSVHLFSFEYMEYAIQSHHTLGRRHSVSGSFSGKIALYSSYNWFREHFVPQFGIFNGVRASAVVFL